MVRRMETGRNWRPQGRGPSRSQTEAGTEATSATGEGYAPWSTGQRLPDESLDAATRGTGCRKGDRRPVSPRSCVEGSGRNGLDPAAAGQTSSPTKCREGEALARRAVAGSKKKARRQRAWIFFQDESGVSQRPSIRTTWAPKGETPVLIHAFNWSKISICAAIGYRWDGRRSRVFFQTLEGNYNSESLIASLRDLKRQLRGEKAILVWDGLPAHKSKAMQDYLFAQRSWLTVERLPGYAPDLNPVETMWGNIKGQELANRCAEDLPELDAAVRRRLQRVRRSRKLPLAFLKHAGLSF